VFHAGSTHALTAAIKPMILNPQLMALMGLNARRFTLEKAPDSTETYSTILHLDPQQITPASGAEYAGTP